MGKRNDQTRNGIMIMQNNMNQILYFSSSTKEKIHQTFYFLVYSFMIIVTSNGRLMIS